MILWILNGTKVFSCKYYGSYAYKTAHLPWLVFSSRWCEAPQSPARTYPPSHNTIWHWFYTTDLYKIFTETYSLFSVAPTVPKGHPPNAHIQKCFYLSILEEKDTLKDKLSPLSITGWSPGQGLLKAVNYLCCGVFFKRISPKQRCSVPQALWHSICRRNRYSRRQKLVGNRFTLTLYPTGSFLFPLHFYRHY